jgi:phosphoglycerate kinase
LLTLKDVDLTNKRVLIRTDLNVPMDGETISDDARIIAALPSIEYALKHNASVIIMSHLGRPKPGAFDPTYSLAPVATYLSEKLKQEVSLTADWQSGLTIKPGRIVLCENVRFLSGETENNTELAQAMASLCDVFVMDAFATIHRAHASTCGVAQHAPIACAGLLLQKEWDAVASFQQSPKKPVVAIIGGSKVSTKLELLKSLIPKVDTLITGGGIANTLLAGQGFSLGNSFVENDMIETARELLDLAKRHNTALPLATDVICASSLQEESKGQVLSVDEVPHDQAIFDIGPNTQALYQTIIAQANTILWNGPVGVFEHPSFAQGTKSIAEAVVTNTGYSLAGGGDTIAALNQWHLEPAMSYVSTGGGALLALLENQTQPGLSYLD